MDSIEAKPPWRRGLKVGGQEVAHFFNTLQISNREDYR